MGSPLGREGRQSSVLGARLAYIAWLHDQGRLPDLVEHEQALWRDRLQRAGTSAATLDEARRRPVADPEHAFRPSTLTAAVRLDPGADKRLNLNERSVERINRGGRLAFDLHRPAVSVSVRFLGSRTDLHGLGVISAVQAGDIFIGWVNLHRIDGLAAHPAVTRIEALPCWTPTSLTIAGQPAGESTPAAPTPPATALTGAGVRLAVIDLGFDFLHPCLLRPSPEAEQVRALWLHDFNEAAPISEPAGSLGRRFSGADLQSALDWYNGPPSQPAPDVVTTHFKRLIDAEGSEKERTLITQHGTAVAGIAAGNGRASSSPPFSVPPRPGVAPNADLLLIAIAGHDQQRFADTLDIHKGFELAFEDGSAPCVALMADSDNLGPHDGTLDGEAALDDLLLLPGRAIVLTAGNLNHGADDHPEQPAWHAVAAPGPDGTRPLVLEYRDGAPWPDAAEVWFTIAPDVPVVAKVAAMMDGTPMPPVDITPGSSPTTLLTPAQNANRTRVEAILVFDAASQAYCLQFFFTPDPERTIVPSTWSITVPADGPVHGWLDRNNGTVGHWIGQTAQAGGNATTIGSPAVCRRALAVASIRSPAGEPSAFSGRGPIRASSGVPRKPDLAAIGEDVVGPLGEPGRRLSHTRPSGSFHVLESGTSYAAPQVAGACALLFERFGPAATWADIRQVILQAAARTRAMPAPEADGWDGACGHGMLDLSALAAPSIPTEADVWIQKSADDSGAEPFVAATFWDSPSLVLEDEAGRRLDPARVATGQDRPARLRVTVRNRGGQSAHDVDVSLWWAPLGAIHPVPHQTEGGGAWQRTGIGGRDAGNLQRAPMIDPGGAADVVFDWTPPTDANGSVQPHVLIATAGSDEDPFDPGHTLCAQNNAAALAIAPSSDRAPVQVQITGSGDVDGLIVSSDDPNASLRISALPITALPWRDAGLFTATGRSGRPLFGAPDAPDDVANGLTRTINNATDVTSITDVLGAERLEAADGSVTIEGRGRLTLPRLRLFPGATLLFGIMSQGSRLRGVHVLHLSGGQRVGGASVRLTA